MRIRVASVAVEYDRGFPTATAALRGVSLSMEQGECIAIIGPTGSGKTTLLEAMAGLAGPTAGVAEIEPSGNGAALKASVGLVYQFPECQFFEETVYDDVAFGPRRQGLGEEDVRGRVMDALTRAGLPVEDFAGRNPLSLSAGEKRRAAIACILALRRPFLLLDEPSAGLDPATRERIADLIEKEVGSGRGVAIVTHDLELADRVADRVVVMEAGSILADRETSSVFSDAELVDRLRLDPPPAYVLVRRLREVAPEVSKDVARVVLGARGTRSEP
jgi:energy-coupling factor transport system ATP-binding protein